MRVLLVDDEELVANMLRLGLERLGYQVTTRPAARRVWPPSWRRRTSYDVVVSDQIMRGLTGVRLAREIHVLRPNVPVILMTGFRDSVEDDRAAAAGVFEVLEKPLSHVDLGGAIEPRARRLRPPRTGRAGLDSRRHLERHVPVLLRRRRLALGPQHRQRPRQVRRGSAPVR